MCWVCAIFYFQPIRCEKKEFKGKRSEEITALVKTKIEASAEYFAARSSYRMFMLEKMVNRREILTGWILLSGVDTPGEFKAKVRRSASQIADKSIKTFENALEICQATFKQHLNDLSLQLHKLEDKVKQFTGESTIMFKETFDLGIQQEKIPLATRLQEILSATVYNSYDSIFMKRDACKMVIRTLRSDFFELMKKHKEQLISNKRSLLSGIANAWTNCGIDEYENARSLIDQNIRDTEQWESKYMNDERCPNNFTGEYKAAIMKGFESILNELFDVFSKKLLVPALVGCFHQQFVNDAMEMTEQQFEFSLCDPKTDYHQLL